MKIRTDGDRWLDARRRTLAREAEAASGKPAVQNRAASKRVGSGTMVGVRLSSAKRHLRKLEKCEQIMLTAAATYDGLRDDDQAAGCRQLAHAYTFASQGLRRLLGLPKKRQPHSNK